MQKGDVNVDETEKQGAENLQENPGKLSLTVKEAAKHIDETPSVIRNWMRELKTHIPTIQAENTYHYFDEKAIERLLLIKSLSRDRGYSIKQIDFYLSTGEDPLKPEKPPEDLMMKELKAIREELKWQRDFNQALVQKLEEHERYISNSLDVRDQALLSAIREVQQNKIEAAATSPTSTPKGFFARLFSINSNK